MTLALALALGGCGEPPARAPERFEGVFVAQSPQGRVELTLVEVGDEVRITSEGETSIGRRVGPDRVEGRQMLPDGDSSYVLVLRGGRLAVRWTVTTPEGGKVELPEVILERVPASSAGAAKEAARDARLVGHWRATEARAGGDLSYATDTHLVLSDDGAYETWQKSAGTTGESETRRLRGRWSSAEGRLWLRSEGDRSSGEGGWRDVGRFGLTDTHLMLDRDGEKTVFERL